MKNTGLIIGVVLVVLLAVLLLGGVGMTGFGGLGMMGGYGGGGMMGGYGGGGMMGGLGAQGFGYNPLGAILSLAFWALLIGGIVLLVVWLSRNFRGSAVVSQAGSAPLEIIKTRYARGEITREQFELMRKDVE